MLTNKKNTTPPTKKNHIFKPSVRLPITEASILKYKFAKHPVYKQKMKHYFKTQNIPIVSSCQYAHHRSLTNVKDCPKQRKKYILNCQDHRYLATSMGV